MLGLSFSISESILKMISFIALLSPYIIFEILPDAIAGHLISGLSLSKNIGSPNFTESPSLTNNLGLMYLKFSGERDTVVFF